MKTIEEKAKAYDEALERARKELDACGSQNCDAARQIFRLFHELAEPEDEKIRKGLIKFINDKVEQGSVNAEQFVKHKSWLAWLEKQGEHTNFLSKIQVGDRVTRNEDGVLVNISQLNRVAKKRKKQGEQKKPDWSEEDERNLNDAILFIETGTYSLDKDNLINWLKSIKDRVQPQSKQEWKQKNTDDLTDFENTMMHIGESFFGKNAGLDPNDTNVIKEQANLLLELVPKQKWSEEDEKAINDIMWIIEAYRENGFNETHIQMADSSEKWLKSLRPRSQWKPNEGQISLLQKEDSN